MRYVKNSVVAKNASTELDGKTYQIEYYYFDDEFSSPIAHARLPSSK